MAQNDPSHEEHPIYRIGFGGPVGSGKTAIIEALVPTLIEQGHSVGIITNDIYTQEDANHIRRELNGILDPARIVGVETGSCPHGCPGRSDDEFDGGGRDGRALPGYRHFVVRIGWR